MHVHFLPVVQCSVIAQCIMMHIAGGGIVKRHDSVALHCGSP